MDASAPRRARAAEIRIGRLLSLFAEEHAHVRRLERAAVIHGRRHRFQGLVRRPQAWVAAHAQHAAGSVVVGPQSCFPIGQVAPGRRFEQAIIRLHQHVGVPQTAAAHAAAVQNHHVVEHAYLQNSETAQGRKPEIFPHPPIGRREVFVAVALAALQHQHAVALLGEAHGRHTAAEAGADDDKIISVFRNRGHDFLLVKNILSQYHWMLRNYVSPVVYYTVSQFYASQDSAP